MNEELPRKDFDFSLYGKEPPDLFCGHCGELIEDYCPDLKCPACHCNLEGEALKEMQGFKAYLKKEGLDEQGNKIPEDVKVEMQIKDDIEQYNERVAIETKVATMTFEQMNNEVKQRWLKRQKKPS